MRTANLVACDVQQLSTYKLSHEERVDPDCDVLTGCHLVDSKFRMMIIEGLQRGAMGLVCLPLMPWFVRCIISYVSAFRLLQWVYFMACLLMDAFPWLHMLVLSLPDGHDWRLGHAESQRGQRWQTKACSV